MHVAHSNSATRFNLPSDVAGVSRDPCLLLLLVTAAAVVTTTAAGDGGGGAGKVDEHAENGHTDRGDVARKPTTIGSHGAAVAAAGATSPSC